MQRVSGEGGNRNGNVLHVLGALLRGDDALATPAIILRLRFIGGECGAGSERKGRGAAKQRGKQMKGEAQWAAVSRAVLNLDEVITHP